MLRDGERELQWDAKGRLKRVQRAGTVEEYVYAFDDTRAVRRSASGDGNDEVRNVAEDVEVRSGRVVRYVNLAGQRIARLDAIDVGPEETTSSVGQVQPSNPVVYLMLLLLALALFHVVAGQIRALRPTLRAFPGFAGGRVGWASLAAAALALSCGGGDNPAKGKPITQVPSSAVFFHADLHGSPLAVTSAKGDVVRQVSYHAYGAERFQNGRQEPFSFVGKERDSGSGLSDFGARAYRPELGIFVSPDPVAVFEPEEGIGDPRRLLPYSYGGGDPITQVDPSGRIFDTIVDIGFVAYDLYRIGADNVFGNEDNLGTNLAALAADVVLTFVPGGTGGGLAVRAGDKAGDMVHLYGAAKPAVRVKTHGNSKLSEKPQHLYEIKERDVQSGKIKTHKYGVSGGKIKANGKSQRAETQVRKLTRDAKGTKVYSSHIKQRQGASKGARGKVLDSEKKWVEQYRKMHGGKRPQGNQKP